MTERRAPDPTAAGRCGSAPVVIVGLMSGTSVDGVAAAVVRFGSDGADALVPELLGYLARPYTQAQRSRLLRAMEGVPPAEYCRLNFELGEWLADAALAALRRAGVVPGDTAAIASHGQTVWHEPGHSTWQLGESAVIAERTGIDVISDFRVRDIAAGGQGAPLVPIADALLFAAPDDWRALQNLGGIGNVSVVPPRGACQPVRAFDTGPGCAVIDGVTRALIPSLPYDVDGSLARRGRVIDAVVDEALTNPFFAAPPPKSTGRELFSTAFIDRFIADCRSSRPDATVEDVVATAVALTARSIADAYARFIPEPVSEVVLSGGGARNPVLVGAIRDALAGRAVRLFDELFFDGEAKEAVAFALLGLLHLQNRPGNVPSATGARAPRVLGKRCPS